MKGRKRRTKRVKCTGGCGEYMRVSVKSTEIFPVCDSCRGQHKPAIPDKSLDYLKEDSSASIFESAIRGRKL